MFILRFFFLQTFSHCQIERVRSDKMLATEQSSRSLTICSFYSRNMDDNWRRPGPEPTHPPHNMEPPHSDSAHGHPFRHSAFPQLLPTTDASSLQAQRSFSFVDRHGHVDMPSRQYRSPSRPPGQVIVQNERMLRHQKRVDLTKNSPRGCTLTTTAHMENTVSLRGLWIVTEWKGPWPKANCTKACCGSMPRSPSTPM
ncbi:hypothetical protein DM01DRAFT_1093584 [Hesseltinella vesiculosa]|uniref:Uncharacterized protein n=1 Tax=Hesseltinella vesiculosa TaxID=101127 RepID=A0A1X2GD51_9FUNG|nr:hypothetical protein DM01DRAFT_1093584 [Hesseltinella vesiculosa]